MSMPFVSTGRIALRFGFRFVCLFACLGVARAAQSPVMFTEPDGDMVGVELRGPGGFTGTLAGLTLTGTKAKSTLRITVTPGGGDGRAALGGIAADAGIGVIDAPAGVLDGALAVAGKIAKLTLAASTDGASAAATALGAVKVLDGDLRGTIATPGRISSITVTAGDLRARVGAGSIGPIKVAKSVGGAGGSIVDSLIAAATKITAITVAGDVTNSRILAGVKLGSDLALGGAGAEADVFGAGSVGRVSIGGAMSASILGAGLSPFDGVFGNGNDGVFGGKRSKLGGFTVVGALSADSLVGAGKFAVVKVAGVRIRVPALDPRFITRKLVPSKLPSDPAMVASAINPTLASNLPNRIAFLYTGRNPIQTGVAPGTIKPESAAVVRGTVKNQGGAALAGVMVTVLDRTEYGETFTRADGVFDFALNGGATYNFLFEKEGFCPVQRQVIVPLHDAVMLEDVAMMTLDPAATTVALGAASAMQMHTATMQSDADGDRQASLMFAPGTEASLVMPDGTIEPLTSLKIRATEFTVGPQGPAAMPGTLPGTSAYTYCAELTADEAIAADATSIVFNQPVWLYVDNFTGFTVGIDVPSGFYNRQTGLWEGGPSGKVMKVVSITSDLADIDTDGNDVADNAGIGTEERQQLALRFAAGATFWRVPIPHFSPWDCNWPFGPPNDATAPNADPARPDDPDIDPDCCGGSTIEAQTRVLGENASLVGVPFDLNYRSDRVPGRKAASRIRIPLTRATVPASLKRVELEVTVAGRMFRSEFAATPSLETTFEWDGLDSYGRKLVGRQPAVVSIGFVYDGVYGQTSRFGFNSNGTQITGSRTREEITLHSSYTVEIGAFDLSEQSIGGWSFDVHHAYDPGARTVFLGNGNVQQATTVGQTISTIAGTGSAGFSGDGGPARLAQFSHPSHVDLGPDGSLYVSDRNNNRIRRIAPDGTITTIGGNGQFGNGGDDGPATAAQIEDPVDLRVGPDGSIYICPDDFRGQVRRIAPDGTISTFAGTGTTGFSGDNGPATSAQFGPFLAARPAADGSVYITDLQNNRLRRVMPDGTVYSVMGPTSGFSGDGGPALTAGHGSLLDPISFTSGDVVVADWSNNRLRRVGADGIIRTIAGGGSPPTGNGDGGLATLARLRLDEGFGGSDVDAGPDGSIYLTQRITSTIRRITPDGIIRTIAGNGTQGRAGDGGPALAAQLSLTGADICVGPDGAIYVPDASNHVIRKIAPPLPGFSGDEIIVPSADGAEVFLFDATGRHRSTRDALTGATLFTFGYDARGRLVKITDVNNNAVTIQRDGMGNPTAVVSPYAQKTRVTVNAEGFLASITNPAGETRSFTYNAGGLLASQTDALGRLHTFTYDAAGTLVQDDEPGPEATTLSVAPDGTVSLTSALGRTQTFSLTELPDGTEQRVNTLPNGLAVTETRGENGVNRAVDPDGSITTVTTKGDPRFGFAAPFNSAVRFQTPGGRDFNSTSARTATLATADDPFSLTTLNETSTVNGRTTTTNYDAATRTRTVTTPEGRVTTKIFDADARPVSVQVPGVLPIVFAYDARGRLASITQGTGADERKLTYQYDPRGLLKTATDALGRATNFTYDAAGRVTHQRFADGSATSFAYDEAGQLTAVTPPARKAHAFAYDVSGRVAAYTPPSAGAFDPATTFTRNADADVTTIAYPGGASLDLGFDVAGRLATQTLPGSVQNTFAYHPTTGKMNQLTSATGSTVAFTYDGPLTTVRTWSGATAGSVTTAYDNSLRLTSQQVNALTAISFSYDNDDLVTQAGALAITRGAASGFVTGTTLGVVTDSSTYNPFGDEATFTASISGGAAFAYTLGYDRNGSIVTRSETIAGTTHNFAYGYDVLDRLVEVKRDGAVVSTYTYDANGNRLTRVQNGTTTNYTTDAQDRLLTAGTATFTYTPNGDIATRTVGADVTSYTYDVTGNLTHVTLPDTTQIDYVIDGFNRRVGRKVNGTLVQGFLYLEGQQLVAELDGSNAVVAQFIYGTSETTPDYIVKGGATFRVVRDHLGSPRLIVDTATGAIAQRLDYDEFGVVTQDTAPGFQPFGFTGGLYDPATGLVRLGARDYDASVGRWTAKDRILFAGGDTNLYAWVGNDPLNFIDPTGAAPKPIGSGRGKSGSSGSGGGACKVSDFFKKGVPKDAVDKERAKRTAELERFKEENRDALRDFDDPDFNAVGRRGDEAVSAKIRVRALKKRAKESDFKIADQLGIIDWEKYARMTAGSAFESESSGKEACGTCPAKKKK